MKLPENILKAIEILTGSGFEAWVVGGCVRDMIMGKDPADYDITTNALPQHTAACFKDYTVVETGIKHGTVTVVMDGENIEITTYRVDGEYLDNRRPEKVKFTRSLEEDLKRRDFTMNAIAYNPEKGIFDPMDGESDIKKRLIRCVGDPDKRFNEDGLRILRALRFASQTEFDIDGDTARAVRENKNLIKNLSAERIFVELKKLLCGSMAHKVINDYSEVLGVFLPEILPMVGFEQRTKYHCHDVFTHTLEALKNCERDEVLRLAVFLHDVGKPPAFYEDMDGTAHFKGHAVIGAKMARDILNRLKSDNNTKNTVCALIESHSEKVAVNRTEIKSFVSLHGFEFAKLLIKVKKADASAKAPEYRNITELVQAEKIIKNIEESGEPVFLTDLAVSGNDLIGMGLSGEQVGKMLHRLLACVLLDETQNNREKLLKIAEGILNENA